MVNVISIILLAFIVPVFFITSELIGSVETRALLSEFCEAEGFTEWEFARDLGRPDVFACREKGNPSYFVYEDNGNKIYPLKVQGSSNRLTVDLNSSSDLVLDVVCKGNICTLWEDRKALDKVWVIN